MSAVSFKSAKSARSIAWVALAIGVVGLGIGLLLAPRDTLAACVASLLGWAGIPLGALALGLALAPGLSTSGCTSTTMAFADCGSGGPVSSCAVCSMSACGGRWRAGCYRLRCTTLQGPVWA